MSRAPIVEIAGYLGSAVGVGEAARLYLGALRSAGVSVRASVLELADRDGVELGPSVGPVPAAEDVDISIICLNPEQLVPYLSAPDAPARASRMTVGIWSWEVDKVPPGWREAAGRLTEIWTYSTFAAEMIGAEIGRPVLAMPPPVPLSAELARLEEPFPAGFRVLTMFDYLSTLERKNPIGAIRAYREAFGPGDGAILIVKSVNGRHRLDRMAEVNAAIGGRPDIITVDRTLPAGERDALVSACDCYLSLHRAEGHGLPLGEAMAAGKPVVATAYGGNTEFMTEENSYLVAWSAARVGERVEHYPHGASWAEPDHEHAVRLLRTVYEDRDEAARRAHAGQAHVRAMLAPKVVGARMRARLEELDSGDQATAGRADGSHAAPHRWWRSRATVR